MDRVLVSKLTSIHSREKISFARSPVSKDNKHIISYIFKAPIFGKIYFLYKDFSLTCVFCIFFDK